MLLALHHLIKVVAGRRTHDLKLVWAALRWRLHLEFTLDKAYELLVAHEVPDAAHDHGQNGPAALLRMVIDVLLPILVTLRRRRLSIALRVIPCRLPCALQAHHSTVFTGAESPAAHDLCSFVGHDSPN